LSYAADHVERRDKNDIGDDCVCDQQRMLSNKKKTKNNNDDDNDDNGNDDNDDNGNNTNANASVETALTATLTGTGNNNQNYQALELAVVDGREDGDGDESDYDERSSENSRDAATFDFIGMTSAIFDDPSTTRLVTILYYTNIFLVLGNYIIVMSHAVIALFDHDGSGDGVLSCLPIAGLLASTLMFAVCQLRTMAGLGRTASTVSLSAMAIVLVQCLYFSRGNNNANRSNDSGGSGSDGDDDDEFEDEIVGFRLLLRQLSACGSIGFATGSQKLLLNIRHEFADRNDAPTSLGMGLTVFGTVYVLIVVLAGSNPPGLLFDAIPRGTIHRQAAGLFLWIHVVVSYAINSQAICASMDRNFFGRWEPVRLWSDQRRWTVLTAIMASSAFFIANAVPFFKDLVAFIGALTAVPLTLLLPAVFYRGACEKVAVWLPPLRWDAIVAYRSWGSYSLLVYSSVFMVTATLGSVYSILSDWEHHTGGFFSCQ